MFPKYYLLLLILMWVVAAPAVNATGRRIHPRNDTADVLLGPSGSPSATGPTSTTDDFTNRSIGTGMIAAEGATTQRPESVVFKNTLQNTGTGDDAFIITAPSIPAGFRVEISIDDGERYVPVDPWTTSVTVAVAYRAATTILVRVTAPTGLPSLTGFDTVIRATSTVSPSVSNETINRTYTGFIRLQHTLAVTNRTGVGGPTDVVSRAEMEFIVTYSNISTANGTGCALLTAYNLVIVENGNAPPNNWAATTNHIIGASDTQGGYIVGDRENSSSLTNIVMRLDAGQSGVFRFKRTIR